MKTNKKRGGILISMTVLLGLSVLGAFGCSQQEKDIEETTAFDTTEVFIEEPLHRRYCGKSN